MSAKLMKINFANTEMQILDNSHLFTYIYTNRKQTEWWHKGSNLYVHTSIFFCLSDCLCNRARSVSFSLKKKLEVRTLHKDCI